MELLQICGLAAVAVALNAVLRGRHPEFAFVLSLLTGVLILGSVLVSAAPLFQRLHSLLEAAGMGPAHVQILFKSLGLCLVTQIACDACRDLGESGIAARVETAGKLAVLLLSLPLFEEVLQIAGSLIGQGGLG